MRENEVRSVALASLLGKFVPQKEMLSRFRNYGNAEMPLYIADMVLPKMTVA